MFRLTDYTSLHVRGDDARAFLQSQLSSNVDAVDASRAQLSGWHDPKGRTLAVMIVLAAPRQEGFLLVFPRELEPKVLPRMKMFILRSRVVLEGGPAVAGVTGRPQAFETAADAAAWHVAPAGDSVAVRLPGPERWLVVGPVAEQAPEDPGARHDWELANVDAGLPEVYESTQGAFVAQMLNLDELGGVSFTKGCFPGQEIIARAHYLGRVKRRMQRFSGGGPPPSPGEALADGPGGTVVRAAALDGGFRLLAVVPADAPGPFSLADGRALTPA